MSGAEGGGGGGGAGERAAAGRSDDGARTVEAEGGASVRWRRFMQWRPCGCGSGEGGLPLDGEKGRGRQIALIGIWSRFVWWGGDLDFEEKFVVSSSFKSVLEQFKSVSESVSEYFQKCSGTFQRFPGTSQKCP